LIFTSFQPPSTPHSSSIPAAPSNGKRSANGGDGTCKG